MNKTYPKQVFSVMSGNKDSITVLGVDAVLSAVTDTEEDNSSVFGIHNGYSRYEFTILQNKKSATLNIKPLELPAILKRLEIAMKMELTKPTVSKNTDGTSLSYTTAFRAGKYKGQTPASLLLSGTPADDLLNQISFLEENAVKYAYNNTLIAAIKEAVNLQKENKLTAASVGDSGTSILPLFETRDRTKAKQNENGNNLVCGGSITYTYGNKYPVCVKIKNFYAPIEKLPDGRQKVIEAKAEDNVELGIYIAADEMYNRLTQLIQLTTYFEQANFATCAKLSEKYMWKPSEEPDNSSASSGKPKETAVQGNKSTPKKEDTAEKETEKNTTSKPSSPGTSITDVGKALSFTCDSITEVVKADQTGNYKLQVKDGKGAVRNVLIPPQAIMEMGTLFPKFVESCKKAYQHKKHSHFSMTACPALYCGTSVLIFQSFNQ